jgi:hypothetical protein
MAENEKAGAAAPQPSRHRQRRAAPRANQRRLRQESMPAPATCQAGSGPRPRQQPLPARWLPQQGGQPGRLAPCQPMPHGPPPEGALCGGQPTGMARRSTGSRGRPRLKGLRGGRNSQALPSLAERERERASSRHTVKKPKQRYPQIITRSGARPIVPAERPLGPRSPQALPRVAPLPAWALFPPQTPKAPRERPAQASSRRPRDRSPVRSARAPALRGHAVRPVPPESTQSSRPRGQVPPRPASAPRTGTLVSRP